MPLPHYTQLQGVGSPGGPGTLPDEVVYKNLFEITFILPVLLQAQGRDPILLLQNATKIAINTTSEHDIKQVKQRFKYSTRVFNTTPDKTDGTLAIPIQINVNQQGSIENWNTMKAWYDLVFNSQNGTLHYKSDIIGTIIVNQHDKKGVVLKRITYQNVQIKQLNGYALEIMADSVTQARVVDTTIVEPLLVPAS